MKKSFGERLKELRGDLSQDDFALKIGTKQTTLSNWERGFREPNYSGLVLIANSCGVSADWLLGLTDERVPGATGMNQALLRENHDLKVENEALKQALAIVGGRPALPVKTGGAPATKIA